MLHRRTSGVGRAALSLALALALVPLPVGSGLTPDPAIAATVQTPYASLLTFPGNPHAVWAPGAVAVDASGTVFIADTGNDRIRVLTAAGGLLASWGTPGSGSGQLSGPVALALGPDGRVYVADTGNNRVEVFETNGTFVRTFGSSGTGDGQFDHPAGIALDTQGSVYVSDTYNGRIQRFNSTGAFVEKWGSKGGNADQFDSPRGIAVDADGFVYVVDTNKHYVKKFNPLDRAIFTIWGTPDGTGTGVSRYANPTGISLSPDGLSLIVADTGNCRIERCSLAGVVIESIGGLPASSAAGRFSRPGSAALNPTGALVVADSGNNRIALRDSSSNWMPSWDSGSALDGLLSSPQAVASNAGGTVYYVADTLNSRVLRYDASGAYLGVLAGAGVGNGQVNAPAGLCVLADDTVLVADTGNNRIQRFDAAGAFVSVIGAGVLSSPRGMAVTSLDVLLVADTGNNRVARFQLPSGSPLSSFGVAGTGDGQLNAPRGVAVSGNQLWVADTGNHRVQKFNANTGTFSLKIGGFGSGASQMSQPMSVAVDGTDVVVADTGNNRIQRFDSVGTWLQAADGTYGPTPGRMHAPACVAIAPGSRTLVAERDGGLIRVFVADTTPPRTTIAGVPSAPVSAATLSFSAVDSGSGVAATYYRIGSVTTRASGPITLTSEGPYAVAYWSVDLAGNIEPEQIASFTIAPGAPIDITAPTGSFSVGQPPLAGTSTFPVTSAVVGASEMRIGWQASPGSWVPYAATTSVTLPSTPGSYVVSADYRDAAGNVLSCTQTVLVAAALLDTTPPATRISGLPVGPTNQTATVSLAASDSGSGVATTWYRIDAGPAKFYAAPFEVSREGATSLSVWSVDAAGNSEPPLTRSIVIDRTGPVVAGLSSPTHGSDPWSAGTVGLSWTPSSDGSGVGGYAVSMDASPLGDGAPGLLTSAVSVDLGYPPAGAVWAHVRAVDALGNWGPITTIAIRPQADMLSPVTAIHGVRGGVGVAPVALTLDATDDVSGVAATWYRIGTGADRLYTGPIVVRTIGTTVIRFWSVDRAGLTEPAKSATFTLKAPMVAPLAGRSAPRVKRTSLTSHGSRFVAAGTIAKKAVGGRVRMVFYRYERGHWVRRATSGSTVVSRRGSTAYSARYSVPFTLGRGTWRVRTWYTGNTYCSAAMGTPSARFVVR